HRAFAEIDRSLPSPSWPPPVPELDSEGPPSAVLRYGILRHGCVLVRGLIRPTRAARLRDAIDRAFDACDATVAGRATPATAVWYDPFESLPRADETRPWVRQGGGVLAA